MNTLRILVLATTLGLTLGACGKKQDATMTPASAEPPAAESSTAGSTDPSAASSPSQRDALGAETPETPAGGSTDPGAASTPSQQEATEPPPQN